MSGKIQVYVDLEQTFVFFPITNEQDRGIVKTMWIDTEFYKEWKAASDRFYELNNKMEQLYRIQEGKTTFESVEIPSHELIGD